MEPETRPTPKSAPSAQSGVQATTGTVTLNLPEHGQLILPIAGVGTRGVAALVDAALLGLLATLLVGSATLLKTDSTIVGALSVLGAGLLPVLLPLLFEARWQGQTPGKRLMSLRVVAADGLPASLGALFLRNVMRLCDFLPFGYGIGLITMAASRHGQRLGDLVASTLVIREDVEALTDLGLTHAPFQEGHALSGLPESVLLAAKRLLDPSRDISPQALQAREHELAEIVRRYRPDLALESNQVIWQRLREAVGE